MNELQVIIRQEPGKIDFNFDELKAALAERMDLYKDAVFSEEYKVQAKGEVASLRKMRKALDDRRKLVKKQVIQPYEEFEEKVKELLALIDEPITLIDGQIKDIEKKQKAEKRAKIKEFFDANIGDMGSYLNFDQIYDSRWENVSVTMKSVQDAILSGIDRVKQDVSALSSNVSEAAQDALKEYARSHDLSRAYDVINQYERQKAEILKREEERRKVEEDHRRQQEIERVRQQERERIVEEERIRMEERKKAEEQLKQEQRTKEAESFDENMSGFFSAEADGELPFEQPDTVTAFYKVVATPEELEQVETAFNSIGIFFERRDA